MNCLKYWEMLGSKIYKFLIFLIILQNFSYFTKWRGEMCRSRLCCYFCQIIPVWAHGLLWSQKWCIMLIRLDLHQGSFKSFPQWKGLRGTWKLGEWFFRKFFFWGGGGANGPFWVHNWPMVRTLHQLYGVFKNFPQLKRPQGTSK